MRPLGIWSSSSSPSIVARLGSRVIRRVLERVGQPGGQPVRARTRTGARVATMSGVVANVWRFFVFVVAGAIVLGMLGINLTPLLASATIIGATLGFGAQQIVRDYFSGILMTVEDQYNVGDSVTVGGVTGVVEEVTMRLTRFRGVDGTIFVIPNGDIRLVGNLSRGWARAVVDLTLPGAGAADLETVRSVIAAAAHKSPTSPRSPATAPSRRRWSGCSRRTRRPSPCAVMLLTVPSQRDALTRALREPLVGRLAQGTRCGPPRRNHRRPRPPELVRRLAPQGRPPPRRATWPRPEPAPPSTARAGPPPGGPACRVRRPRGHRPPPPPPATGSAGGVDQIGRDLAGVEQLRGDQPESRPPAEARPPCRAGWR